MGFFTFIKNSKKKLKILLGSQDHCKGVLPPFQRMICLIVFYRFIGIRYSLLHRLAKLLQCYIIKIFFKISYLLQNSHFW